MNRTRLLTGRRLYLRLGPTAALTYARLSVRDMIGWRDRHTQRVPRGARSFVFVCHGNIMRSAMAAAMMRHLLEQRHSDIRVASAGLHATSGREAHPWAQAASAAAGVSLTAHRAAPVTTSMVEHADAILAMDFVNKAELLTLFPFAAHKVFMLSAYADAPLSDREIPDPFYADEAATRRCCALLMTCVHNLVEDLGL